MGLRLTAEAIQAFLEPDESAAALLHRLRHEQVRTGIPLLDGTVSLRPGELLEVSGPAGCGKTSLVIRIAVECVLVGAALPPGQQPDWVVQQVLAHAPGPRRQAVIVDCDGKLDALHIIQVLRTCRDAAFPNLAAAAGEAEARLRHAEETGQVLPPGELQQCHGLLTAWDTIELDCLSRLHVIRPTSSLELLAGLLALAPTMRAWKDAGQACGVVLIDNVGSFSHSDKANRAHPYIPPPRLSDDALLPSPHPGRSLSPSPHPGPTPTPPPPHALTPTRTPTPPLIPTPPLPPPPPPPALPSLTLPKVHAALVTLLRRLAGLLRVTCVATKYAQTSVQEGEGGSPARLVVREFMPHVWMNAVTHRLVLGAPVAKRDGITYVLAQLSQWGGAHPGPLVDLRLDTWETG